jgi:drug/metabolite transporter (DMT)-like permease
MLNNKAGQFVVLILLGIIWGSSFILMKKGLIALDSWQVASLRLFFAGIIALPFLLRYRKEIQRKDWLFLGLAGFIGNGFPAFMFTYAQETGLESSLTGALNALTPVFTLLVGLLFFGTQSNTKQITGLGIGLLGALAMVWHKAGNTSGTFSFFPFAMVFLATFFYGININIIKSRIGHIKPLLAGMIPLSILAFPATGMVLWSGVPETVSNATEDTYFSLSAVLLLGVLGTAISLFIFNALVQKTSAIFGSAVNYMLPFVAAFWGAIDGEPFGMFEMGALLFILLGIYLIRGR